MPSDVGLVDEDLLGQPLQAAPALLDALLADTSDGLRVWAPAFVALDRSTWVPVHAGAVGGPAELARLALPDRGILVAIDDTGLARVARLDDKGGPDRLPPPPGFEGGLGPRTQARRAEVARGRLWGEAATAWPPGRYRIALVAAGQISNETAIEIARSPSTIDPAVREAAVARAVPAVTPAPDPAGGLPRYQPGPGAPPTPSAPGIALQIERVVTAAPGAVCVLHGSLRAAARDVHRVAHGAIVPVTLVLTGSETPGPHVIRMQVPSFDRDVPAGAPGVTASFSVDLFRLAPLAAAPQTWFIHAFTADGHATPRPVAVVAA